MSTALNTQPSPLNYSRIVKGDNNKVLEEVSSLKFYSFAHNNSHNNHLSKILPTTIEGLLALVKSEEKYYKSFNESQQSFKRKIARAFYNRDPKIVFIYLTISLLLSIINSTIVAHLFFTSTTNVITSFLIIGLTILLTSSIVLAGFTYIGKQLSKMLLTNQDVFDNDKSIVNDIKPYSYLIAQEPITMSGAYYDYLLKTAVMATKIVRLPLNILNIVGLEQFSKPYDTQMELLIFLIVNQYVLEEDLQEKYKKQLANNLEELEEQLKIATIIAQENTTIEALVHYPIIEEKVSN